MVRVLNGPRVVQLSGGFYTENGVVPVGPIHQTAQHERMNRSLINSVTPGPHLELWKEHALKTTNQALAALPEPPIKNGREVWLKMMQRSHSKMFRADALKVLESLTDLGLRQNDLDAKAGKAIADALQSGMFKTLKSLACAPGLQ